MRPSPSPTTPRELVLTGERTLPGIPDEAYWFARHEVAYRLAAARVSGRRVLDAGCGEGYGLAMLARGGAAHVLGADLDPTVVEHIHATYARDFPGRVDAAACELMSLPLQDDAVDLTVSFQVIEHLYDIPGYLASLRRVTRPGGEILIATPNRLTFTPGSDTPRNPFHTREFTAAELVAELGAVGLRVCLVLGLHHGPALRAIETVARRPFTELLSTAPPDEWPDWYRRIVHRVTPAAFRWSTHHLDVSLDLLAVAHVPRHDRP